MGYSRDKDYYTRGVGAIAALDKHGARQLARHRRAQALAQHDHTMASIANGAGRGGMAALGAFGRIATDNGGDGTATGQPGGGRNPGTSTPVTRPTSFMPGKVTASSFAATPKTPRQAQPGGTYQPPSTPGPRTGGGSSSTPTVTSGGIPVKTSSGGGGRVVVDQQTIPGSGSGIPGPLDVPEMVTITDPDITTTGGMSTGKKIALVGGAALAAYLIFGRK